MEQISVVVKQADNDEQLGEADRFFGTQVATLAGAGIGVVSGGSISALDSTQINLDRVDRDRHFQVEYLVANGADDEVRKAKSILGKP